MNTAPGSRAGPVLVVSASAGTGHIRAGDAVCKALRYSGVEAEHVDVLTLTPSWVKVAYGGGFDLMAQRAPRLWREIYARTDGPVAYDPGWGPIAHRILFRAFHRLLLDRPWRACISTHFLPTHLAAGLPDLPPFSLVVTDFELHRYWVQPRVRDYYLGHADSAQELVKRLPGAQVHVTGIPIDPAFAAAPSREAARALLQLPAHGPIALVMGGGIGIGVEETVRAALDARVDNLQIVAVCARNEEARAQLNAMQLPEEKLKVLGFVHDIQTLFSAASVVVTKPGGLSTSEALAMGKPLILTRPIPGHEEANVRYLQSTSAARYAPTAAAVSRELESLFNNPLVLDEAAAAAALIGKPNAAADIAACVTMASETRWVA